MSWWLTLVVSNSRHIWKRKKTLTELKCNILTLCVFGLCLVLPEPHFWFLAGRSFEPVWGAQEITVAQNVGISGLWMRWKKWCVEFLAFSQARYEWLVHLYFWMVSWLHPDVFVTGIPGSMGKSLISGMAREGTTPSTLMCYEFGIGDQRFQSWRKVGLCRSGIA